MRNKDYQKLRECPFCGGEAKLVAGTFNKNIGSVMCTKCGISTEVYVTDEDAIKVWNTRTNTIPVGNGENYEVVQNERNN